MQEQQEADAVVEEFKKNTTGKSSPTNNDGTKKLSYKKKTRGI